MFIKSTHVVVILLFAIVKCKSKYFAGDKPPREGICAIEKYGSDDIYTLYEKCGKDEICEWAGDLVNGEIYACIPYYPLRDIGDSCVMDDECYLSKCQNNKCISNCENGKAPYESENNCKSVSNKDGSCEGDQYCPFFYYCFRGKCVEYGSMDDGSDVGEYNGILCKSGMEYEGKCISVQTDYIDCSSAGVSIEVNGINDPIFCECYLDYGYNIYFPKYSKSKTAIFQDLINEYKKIDKSKLIIESDNNAINAIHYLDNIFHTLFVKGLIDSNRVLIEKKVYEAYLDKEFGIKIGDYEDKEEDKEENDGGNSDSSYSLKCYLISLLSLILLLV